MNTKATERSFFYQVYYFRDPETGQGRTTALSQVQVSEKKKSLIFWPIFLSFSPIFSPPFWRSPASRETFLNRKGCIPGCVPGRNGFLVGLVPGPPKILPHLDHTSGILQEPLDPIQPLGHAVGSLTPMKDENLEPRNSKGLPRV